MSSKIKLIISDVDGCLTEERAQPFDLALLNQIRVFNQQSMGNPMNQNSLVPPITLCTGRPQPYVEALLKVIDAPLPAIAENGGMIYDLPENRYWWEEKFNSTAARRLQTLKQKIIHYILPRVNVAIQPGKDTHITLIAPNHNAILEATDILKKDLSTELSQYKLTITENCLNIVPHFFDKGTALNRLSQMVNIPLIQMAAVGDTPADLPFMKMVRYPMCPANATPEVKAICCFVAGQSYTAGLIEIIEKCISINKSECVSLKAGRNQRKKYPGSHSTK